MAHIRTALTLNKQQTDYMDNKINGDKNKKWNMIRLFTLSGTL